MKKRILLTVMIALVFFSVFCPFSVQAVTPLEPDRPATLTLHYQKEGVAFGNLQVEIFRVAEAFPDGSFQLIEPYASYPVDIYDITEQAQWDHVAQTLYGYMVANGLRPDRQGQTDANGTVTFTDLKTGLYFVREVTGENTAGTYVFNQFMVYLPTPQQDGSYLYQVEAYPKCTAFTPKTQYTVTKLWRDSGKQNQRPGEVEIEIYKDGVLQETRRLNTGNGWTYTWYVSASQQGKWTVLEKNVANNYKVTVEQKGSHFSVINTIRTKPNTPETGDLFSPLPWILLMSFSGVMLLLLGLYGRRRK